EGWTSATFFGSNGLADNSGPTVGTGSASGTLRTIALNEADALAADSRAMDAIPSHLPSFPAEDARGVARPQPTNGKKDIGAVEEKQGGGNDPGADPSLTIKSVRMSGIPNTLTRVGQTATLTATVVYANGTTSSSEKVTWSSSNPGVARIDAFGNLYARSMGRTVISVAVNRQKTVADSADLTVREEMSYTNVHPEIWKMLGEFNDLLSAQGAGLTIADSDPARVKASAFQKAFRDAWGTSAVQVTELKSRAAIRFKTGQLPSAQGWSTSRSAIDVFLGGRRKGDLLPLRYRWSLSWDELSTLMGRKVTKVEPRELLDVLKPAFISAGGEAYTVVGTDGAAASQAISSGALKVTNGNNGATLELTAFVADATGPAASPAKTGPRIVEGLLVVPDGAADGTISGAMGLLQKAKSGGGNKGEGGGGGCDAGVGGLALIFAAALLRRKRG
uniref:Ig-like domain-containing protein n=1 Tax=uncultured Fretibacterium sp. TaxID=1678694 RepID=UPI00325F9EC4